MRGKRHFDQYIYAYRLALSSGLRPGELTALRICDIDLFQRCIHVNGSINQYNHRTKGKNKNAIRSFKMNDYSYDACFKQMQMLQAAEADGMILRPEDSFFQISKQKSLYDRWKLYTASNGIRDISLYEQRHTFVSLAYELPDGELKPLVGHSRSMDTRGVYGHDIEGREDDTAKKLTQIISEKIEQGREADKPADTTLPHLSYPSYE